jgi:hypothetical protein
MGLLYCLDTVLSVAHYCTEDDPHRCHSITKSPPSRVPKCRDRDLPCGRPILTKNVLKSTPCSPNDLISNFSRRPNPWPLPLHFLFMQLGPFCRSEIAPT